MFFSRWRYYLTSIPTLLLGVKNRLTMLRLFLGMPPKSPVIIELRNGARFQVRSAMDVWIIKEICLDHDYQQSSLPFEDGWTFIDIGAGLGDFAISVAREYPRSTVYAFEPFPESFALMQENLRLNAVANVKAFPYAVSGASAALRLQTATGVPVEHSTAKASSDDDPAALSVKGQALADVFAEHGLERCDYLKVDCEGAEYDIFLQMPEETLARCRHICVEYHDHVTPSTHRDLVRYFEERGFRVKLHPNPVHSFLGMLYATR